MPTIVALIKNVPDTWSTRTLNTDFTLDRDNVDNVIDEINEFAMEQALRLREANPDAGLRVVALNAGPAGSDEALRKALAMGADEAIQLRDDALAGSDVIGTAWALHNAINTIDDVQLIVAGNASSDGAMGALPAILAEYRQVPALTEVSSVTLAGIEITATRETNLGIYELHSQLPAVISVGDKAEKPRFPNFKGLRAAKNAEIATLDLAAVGVAPGQVGLANASTVVRAAENRPTRTAGEVYRANDPAEAATRIADYLTENNLI